MFSWRKLQIPRFYGLDLKNNIIDVKDGSSLGCENVYQNSVGIVSKRRGFEKAFASDESSGKKIYEIGSFYIGATKYFFKFVDGKFKYATSISGATTTITPSPAISTTYNVWWQSINGKLYFVDGANNLRYFDGSAISDVVIYSRPTVALTTASVGNGFDFSYTTENPLGESPLCTTPLVDKVSTASVVVTGLFNATETLAIGDKIRIYSKTTSTVAQWRNVTTQSGAHANGTYGVDSLGGYLILTSTAASYTVTTVALNDSQVILYTDLGVATNASPPTALAGLTVHYGRLVGWKDSSVYVSKVGNVNSFPSDTAVHEAWTYGFYKDDGEKITACKSYQESLYVFKESKMAAFAGVGPDDTGNNAFAFRRIETNGIGCIAGKSIQTIGDNETTSNYLIWLSSEGFYSTTGAKPQRIGEKIETQIFTVARSNLEKSVSVYHKRDGFYYCFVGTDATKIAWALDVQKDEKTMVGWFKLSGINATCCYWDNDEKLIFGNNDGFCAKERNTGTSSDFSDLKTEYINPTDINTGTDVLTVANSYTTGDAVYIRTNTTIPTGITANTVYYAIRLTATTIQLATSQANAVAGTFIDITSQGAGVHSIIGSKAISAFYTTNWIKFKDAATVKKLAKPMILLNASAQSINLTMQIAVDWYESFFDPHTLSVVSSDSWGTDPWGTFVWGAGAVSSPKNIAISRRKARSIRYKFSNNEINQDFNLKGIEQDFAYIRNRGDLSE